MKLIRKNVFLAAFVLSILTAGFVYADLTTADWVDYPYGNQLAFNAAYVSDLNGKYANWKTWFLVSVNATQSRVKMASYDPYPNHTVSEGQAYGMLLSVYFNDKTTFDKLFAYQAAKRNGNGLMMWHLDASGNASGTGGNNSATDSDLDIAFALLKAEQRWPGNSYGAYAVTEIQKIKNKDMNGNRNILPGDWGDPGWTYASYFMPAWFRQFAAAEDATSWNNAITVNNATLTSGRNNTTGFIGEQTYFAGGAGPTDGSQYKYNSCRIPWRYATDYVWNGDATAQGQIQRMATSFNGQAASSMNDCYNVGGTLSTCGAANGNGAFVGPLGAAFMVSATYNAKMQEYYGEAGSSMSSNEYYNTSVALLSQLLIAGYFPANIGGGATPTNTWTPGGPTATNTPTSIAGSGIIDAVADCNNVNEWGGYWYTYNDKDAGGTSTVWPVAASVDPLAEFVMSSPGRTGAPDCAARITGVVTKLAAPGFEYGFVAMGVQVGPDSGAPTFTSFDFSSCEATGGVRFWAKGDGKNYAIKLKAAASVPVGDASYEFAFTAPAAWTQYTVYFSNASLLSKFAQPSWAPPANVVPIAQVLAKITDLQFQTVGQPLASINLWIDDLEFFGCSSYPAPPVVATSTPSGPTSTFTPIPTATYTNTPGGPTSTNTPISTPTNTPNANPGLIDSVADCNNLNNWGGYWYTYNDKDAGGTSIVWPVAASVDPLAEFVMSSPGRAGAPDCAARITGVVTKLAAPGFEYGFVAMGIQVGPDSGAPTFTSFDFTSCEATGGVRFWAKGDGKSYSIKLKAAASVPVGDASYEYSFTAPAAWTQYTVYFNNPLLAHFAQPSWAPPANVVPIAQVLAKITDLQFQTVGQPLATIDLWVDDLEFFGCSTYPTPPAVATPTNTPAGPTATNTPIVPTNTFTYTFTPGGPTSTNTPIVPTNTPNANPGLIDSVADCNNSNNWGGYWYTYNDKDAGGTSTVWPVAASVDPLAEFVMSSPGRAGAPDCAARITGVVTKLAAPGFEYGFVAMGIQVGPDSGAPTFTSFDFTSCEATGGVRFWAKGDGKSYSIKLKAAASVPVGDASYEYSFTAPAAWTQYTVYFNNPLLAHFAQPSWAPPANVVPIAQVLAKITDIQFQTVGQPLVTIDLWVDDLEFFGCSTYPTPPAVATPTNTPAGPTATNTPIVPTNTFTYTFTPGGPTSTNTPIVPTNTPNANPGLIDNVADCNNSNNWGGYWYTYNDKDAGGTSTVWPVAASVDPLAEFVMSSPGRAGAPDCAARITGVVTKLAAPGFEYGFVAMGIQVGPDSGAPTFTSFDFTSCEATGGVRFWAKGDGKSYSIKLKSPASVPVGDASYEYSFTAPAAWTQYTVYFNNPLLAHFAQPSWAPPANVVPIAQVLAKITDIQFQTVGQPLATIDLWVDDLEFFGCSTYPTPPAVATPTNTPAGPTATNTPIGPTSTNTPVYTATNTPIGSTPTNTPTVNSNPGLIDSVADCNNQNEWGGYWYTYNDKDAGGTSTVWPVAASVDPLAEFVMSSPGRAGAPDCAARITGVVTKLAAPGFEYGFVAMGIQVGPDSGAPTFTSFDFTSCEATGGVRFWAKGDGKSYSIKLKAAASVPVGDASYEYSFTAPAAWTQYTVYFNNPLLAHFAQPSWAPPANVVPIAQVLAKITDIQFQTVGQPLATIDLWVDDLEFFGCSTYPTPPVVATPTNTPAVPTATNTLIPTATNTPVGPTSTNTPVATSTNTPVGPTYTYTNTPTHTYTNTPTQTYTFTTVPTVTTPSLSAGINAPANATVGGQLTVIMTVNNNGNSVISNVVPTAPTLLGSGASLALFSGPAPASVASLAIGATTEFTWVYNVTGTGFVIVQGTASGNGGTVTSNSPMSSGTTLAFGPTATATNTPIGTNTPVATNTPTHSNVIEVATQTPVVIYPNPNPVPGTTPGRTIEFTVSKPIKNIVFKIYTSMGRLIRKVEEPNPTPNYPKCSIVVAGSYFNGLAKGVYYYVIIVTDTVGKEAKSPIEKVVIQ